MSLIGDLEENGFEINEVTESNRGKTVGEVEAEFDISHDDVSASMFRVDLFIELIERMKAARDDKFMLVLPDEGPVFFVSEDEEQVIALGHWRNPDIEDLLEESYPNIEYDDDSIR